MESTGSPPLAISSALREGIGSTAEALLQAETAAPPEVQTESSATPAAAEVDVEDDAGDVELAAAAQGQVPEQEPDAEPSESTPARARSRRRSKDDVQGPRIVDTKPHQEIKRDRRAKPRAARSRNFLLPTPDLLAASPPKITDVDEQKILEHASRLEKTLADYGVKAKVKDIHPGPTVTTYEVAPEPGTKVSKVANLADDLALGLSRTVRIIAPIPGKSRIGFELPNDERMPVNLRELVEDKRFGKLAEKAPLPVVLGRDIVGAPFYADLASMPHVIVAGATGAGKSVGLNVMLSSLLFCRTPEELRLLDDRSEGGRAGSVRRHPAHAAARGHRHEAGGHRAALGRRRDGAALPAVRERGHQEHHHLQQLGAPRSRRRGAGTRGLGGRGAFQRGHSGERAGIEGGLRRNATPRQAALYRDRRRRVRRPDDAAGQGGRGLGGAAWRRRHAPRACTSCWRRSGRASMSSPA